MLAGSIPATAAADSFVEVAGGTMAPRGNATWVDLADPSPKLMVRAGTVDRKYRTWRDWGDAMLSFDWTPIRTDAADLSAHRFRMLASLALRGHLGALVLSPRAGIGLDFLRVSHASESDTLVGYALEIGAGVWFPTGSWELGVDLGFPVALNGNATVGGLALDSYLSGDVDLLLGIRWVSR